MEIARSTISHKERQVAISPHRSTHILPTLHAHGLDLLHFPVLVLEADSDVLLLALLWAIDLGINVGSYVADTFE